MATYQTRFRPVLEAAIRYRDADGDAEWHAARLALAVAIVRWARGLGAGAEVIVLNLPTVLRCERWAAVAEAAISYDTPPGARSLTGWDPERRNSCAAWHRLHHAAGRWADVAEVEIPAALPEVAA